jgi:hypothetical protein
LTEHRRVEPTQNSMVFAASGALVSRRVSFASIGLTHRTGSVPIVAVCATSFVATLDTASTAIVTVARPERPVVSRALNSKLSGPL